MWILEQLAKLREAKLDEAIQLLADLRLFGNERHREAS